VEFKCVTSSSSSNDDDDDDDDDDDNDVTRLISELDRCTAVVTRKPGLVSFIRQLMDIAMQRGNAAAIIGTIPSVREG